MTTAVPLVFYCGSSPALLGTDSGGGNFSSFSVQLEVHLAAPERVTSKSQGDVPEGGQHQEGPGI